MLNIGLDLHKRETQICIVDASGALQLERRLPTTRPAFTALLGGGSPARILLEAGTESEWVAQHLEAFGHEVSGADPNYAPMYATRHRAVKTDRRDARCLAEACRLGASRVIHRRSAPYRAVQAELAVRESLVRTRTRLINLLRAQLRREGLRLPSGHADHVLPRLARLVLPPLLATTVAPLVRLLVPLQQELAAADARVAERAAADAAMRHVDAVPGIGPVTAAAFVATLGDVARFPSAHQVQAYLGLIPRERSSGEAQHRGAITKRGNTRVRWLLVEAAWGIRRSRQPVHAPLRAWAGRIEARRGKRVAVVALARRLAGILSALWRDGTRYGARPGWVVSAA
ncbi:MAG TPA: IS110 family transposase [Streptosporangiaceae bacterium]